MNKALDFCEGKYINFLNAGDSYTSKNILNKITFELNEDTEIYCGSVYSIDDLNNKLNLTREP